MDEYEKGILIMETMVTRIISESEVSPDIWECAKSFYKEVPQVSEHAKSFFKETIIEIIFENQLLPELEECLTDAYFGNKAL